MIDHIRFVLTLASALGCGLIAGVFFAFSNFVMKALSRLPATQGIPAMQSINVVVLNPGFLGVFVGTAVACTLLAILSLRAWDKPGAAWLLAGSVLYVVGTFLVTRVCNVPLNNALAAVDPASATSAEFWTKYVARWTAWNHVRTIAALAATASLILAVCLSRTDHAG